MDKKCANRRLGLDPTIKLIAFSLIELMISLIVTSCIIAAFTPVITKKLHSSVVSVGGSGNGLDDGDISFGDDCKIWSEHCLTCNKKKGCLGCDINLEPCKIDEHRNGYCECEKCSSVLGENCLECSGSYEPKCSLCDSGYGISKNGCSKCKAPYVSDGSSSCIKCNNGFYQNIDRQSECKPCGIGYYCDKNGERFKCPDGYTTGTTTANKASDCAFNCPAGSYCPNNSPLACPDGTFSLGGYAKTCTVCNSKTPNCAICNKMNGTCSACANDYQMKNFGVLTSCKKMIQSQSDCNTIATAIKELPIHSNVAFEKNLVYFPTGNVSADATPTPKVGGSCVIKFNAGDKGLPLPDIPSWGSTNAGCTNAATGHLVGSKRYTANSANCASYGGYDGCNRTVCNWTAANDICAYYNEHYNPDKANYKFRLPTNGELTAWSTASGGVTYLTQTSMLCDRYSASGRARCARQPNTSCPNNSCLSSNVWSGTPSGSKYWIGYIDSSWVTTTTWNIGSTDPLDGYSVRCLLE